MEVDLERLEDLVADGLLPPEICTELGISQSDFHTEKCISPEFDAALKRGKERAKQAKAQEKKTRAETHGHHWTPQRLEPVSAEVIGPFGQPGDIIRQVLNDTIEDPAQVAQGLSLYGCSAQQIWDLVGEGTSEHEKKQIERAIERGRIQGLAFASSRLFEKIKEGSLGAITFYLKCKGAGTWNDFGQKVGEAPATVDQVYEVFGLTKESAQAIKSMKRGK